VAHCEQLTTFHVILLTQVNELVAAMAETVCPFIEDSYCLFDLDTKEIMSADVGTIKCIIGVGQQQHNDLLTNSF
jgi:hypothetical protein